MESIRDELGKAAEGNLSHPPSSDSPDVTTALQAFGARVVDICNEWAENGFPQARLIARDVGVLWLNWPTAPHKR